MFSIVSCPRCAGQVSITSEASPSAQLHCPLCDSQYPLSELLATLPPALVILDSPPAHGEAQAAAGDLASDEFAPLPADDLAGFAPHAAWDAPAGAESAALADAHHELPPAAEAHDLGFAPLEENELAAPAEPHGFAEQHEFAPAEQHGFAPAEEAPLPPAEGDMFAPLAEAEFAEQAEFNVDEPLELNPHEEAPHAGSFAPLDETIIQQHSFDEPQEVGAAQSPEADFAGHGFGDNRGFDDNPSFDDNGQSHELPLEESEELSFEEAGFEEAAAEQNGDGEMAFPHAEEESPFAEHEGAAAFGQEEGDELEFGAAEPAAFGEEGEPGIQHFAAEGEGEFGGIEEHRFAAAEGGLQPGDYTRVPPPDTGDEFAVAEEGHDFSLPSPGAPPEAPVATKGKKTAKPVKAAKPTKAKSDKPKRSLVGALVAMLAVIIGGATLVGGTYYALIFFMPERDFLNVASKLPSWARPAKKSAAPLLAGGPGALPPAPPMNMQPPAGAQPPLDASAPGMPANPATPDQGNPAGAPPAAMQAEAGPGPADNAAPLGKPAKSPTELEELPGEKPTNPATDLDLLGIPKPKGKPANMPAEEEDPLAPAKPKQPVDDGFGTPPGEKMAKPAAPAEEPPGEEKKPAEAPAAKVPGEELLPGEAPAKPAPAMKDDLGLDQPAKKPEAAAPAEPAEPAAPPVTPINAPVYSLADYDQAMTDVIASVETMDQADTLTPDLLKKARAQYFRRFYRLGEVATFAADDPAAPALGDKVAETTALLRKVGRDPDKLGLIGRAAIKWLAYPNRGEHAGIMVAGSVADIAQMGKLYATNIVIPGVEAPLTVYSGTKPKVAEGDRVILLGSVIDDPKGSLPDYDGAETPVVWNGLTVKLPPEAAE